MSNEFIQKLAHQRAEEIFTAEYYLDVTDSWYLDEKFRFEGLQLGTNSRKPTRKEADIYMGYMQDYFDEYKDKLKSLKRSEKELVIKRNEILSYLDNYKKIGTETFKSCKKQLINDINSCEEKNIKFLLLLYLGLKEDEYQKFLKEC